MIFFFYSVPLSSGYSIWKLDLMSACVSKYKHMEKYKTGYSLFPRVFLKLCGFLKSSRFYFFLNMKI